METSLHSFIDSAKIATVDLTKDKTKSKTELLEKAAISVLFKDLKAQIMAQHKAVQIKEGQVEQRTQRTSAPASTPAPDRALVSEVRSASALPRLYGRTPIALRRTNRTGIIKSHQAFWSDLADFPPTFPPMEQSPDVSTLQLSVVKQLAHYKLWQEKEQIHWLDPAGSPLELASNHDLRNMAYATQTLGLARTLKILVRGSNTKEVQSPWSSDSSGQVFVRDTADAKPPVSLKRPGGITTGPEGEVPDAEDAGNVCDKDLGNAKDPIIIEDSSFKLRPHLDQPTVIDPSFEEPDPATEALLSRPTFDSGLYSTAVAHVIETEACAQMGKNDINWESACELMKADKIRKGREDIVIVQGLAFQMKKHQITAAYWMVLTESTGCLGGMESDEVGYGKTVIYII
uniref:Uncharacterized protein n=1 Tax=Cladonia uncialis subsp. uncialis TaxID=180999 RepID=A0A2K9YDT9_CLAUC|nr:hypothetical protein [Cladonia uncialis subsp. uncialis]